MTRYRLTIEYDGTDFVGWQRQDNGLSIQQELEGAVKAFSGETAAVQGAGRTDAGVHAMAQVAHIELPARLSPMELRQALNGNLKRDVRIDSVVEADDDFHARFSATAREYEYHIVKNYSPITRKYATELKWNINPDLLHECAKLLIGEHDFTSFCKATAEVDNKICTIYKAEWEDMGEYIFRIRANRFLQHMVRYLVGTMLEVARGRFSIKD